MEKKKNLHNSVHHLKKCHPQENKIERIAWTAYICLHPLGQKKKSFIYVFHGSGLLIFSGPLDCQYFRLGGILFLFPSWKKNTSLFSPSLQDGKEEKLHLKRNYFKKWLP